MKPDLSEGRSERSKLLAGLRRPPVGDGFDHVVWHSGQNVERGQVVVLATRLARTELVSAAIEFHRRRFEAISKRLQVLFDQGVPVPLRKLLVGWDVKTAFEMNWCALENGKLLAEAEAAGCSIFMTTDKNRRYQQRLTNGQLAILVISTTSWPRIERRAAGILMALKAAQPGDFTAIEIN